MISIATLSFVRSLTSQSAKCITLNNERYLYSSTVINLNPDKLRSCPYLDNLDR